MRSRLKRRPFNNPIFNQSKLDLDSFEKIYQLELFELLSKSSNSKASFKPRSYSL